MGNLVGGCVYNMFTQRDVHMHCAGIGKRWLSRRFIGECFRYPFIQLGVRRITGLVVASNISALTLDLHLGFKREGIIRKAAENDEDLIVLGMLREECRWLSVGAFKDGSTSHTGPTARARHSANGAAA
jgi:RimJ/RimL family protein N-acetyltransferase